MPVDDKIASMRVNYTRGKLDDHMVNPNPMVLFKQWFDEAVACEVNEPNIMVLSTVKADNKPSSRVVLLKDIKEEGFTFFTNYHSHKGLELTVNHHVSLLFLWIELQRQVRIEGTVTKLSDAESTAYFESRPIESQIGAIVSNQSSVIENREILDAAYEKLYNEHLAGKKIVKPEHWGGYLVKPQTFEFWQGRMSRLHDRIVYEKNEISGWITKRLAP